MTTYEGKGEEHYDAFLEWVDTLARAADQGDRDTPRDAIAALEEVKKQCH